ncbi:hypothetical protein BGZ92_009623 [Podila epicladia]|nr:hypothetical protein BGZ92_009623 [Podila epicladia]
MRRVANCGSPTVRTAALMGNPANNTPEELQCVCALASNKSWATNCHTCDGYVILMLTTQLAAVQRAECAISTTITSTTVISTTITSTTSTSSIAPNTASTQSSCTTTAPAPPSNTGSGAASLKASASVVVAAITAWVLL